MDGGEQPVLRRVGDLDGLVRRGERGDREDRAEDLLGGDPHVRGDRGDLNLLAPLHALLQERHVSRAAARLHVSQPSMSRTLQRLRATLGGELLVRGPRGHQLTPRAERVRAELQLALPRLEHVFSGEVFDPATAARAFRLAGTDGLPRHPADQRGAPGQSCEDLTHGGTGGGTVVNGPVRLFESVGQVVVLRTRRHRGGRGRQWGGPRAGNAVGGCLGGAVHAVHPSFARAERDAPTVRRTGRGKPPRQAGSCRSGERGRRERGQGDGAAEGRRCMTASRSRCSCGSWRSTRTPAGSNTCISDGR
ncbi:LysR family transcriptional regulator [Streptomyces sp. NPDC058417]|uniref:LysR family transcriptional regulator n=1 Tax=unclassified Streptomyces TaxID=2593676 RepID=UPI0036524D32